MIDPADLRKSLRPHGTIALDCQDCAYLGVCGGLDVATAHLNCFEFCDGDCLQCDNVCPRNRHFARQLTEIGGLRFDNLPVLAQPPYEWPVYVPHIHHGSSRTSRLDLSLIHI